MERLLKPAALFIFASACTLAVSQEPHSVTPAPAPQPIVRQKATRPIPFSLDEKRQNSANLVNFTPDDQLSQPDRDLWTGAQSAIRERANAAGLDFNQEPWEARQIVCSALPGHLFLTFTHNGGKGNASAFTASIPRGPGQVRVIPILRHGYSLFSPAPINEQTLSAFNHIRAEEHPAQPSEWLATGLCYAALAGAHPQAGLAGDADQRKPSSAAPGSLTISAGSGGEISFIDLNAKPRRALWTMSFDASGKLLKVTQSAAPPSTKQKVTLRTPTEIQGKPVPQQAEPQGKIVPQQQDPKGKPVPVTNPTAKAVPVH
jgi:hypothetical protein